MVTRHGDKRMSPLRVDLGFQDEFCFLACDFFLSCTLRLILLDVGEHGV